MIERLVSSRDADDLSCLKHLLEWIVDEWKVIRNDSSLDVDMMQRSLKTFEKQLTDKIKEQEIQLSSEDICGAVGTDIFTCFDERSACWLKNALSRCKNISTLSIDEATALLHQLHPPVYLTANDAAELKGFQDKIIEHLDGQKMEWLLNEFKTLTKDQQKQLIKKLIAIAAS